MYVSSHIYNMYEASPPSRPYCVSTIFHSSLFTKRKCNSHSSFFILHLITASARFFPLSSSQKERVTPILHFSFYILHLRRAPVSGALPPDILPVFCYFHWLTSTKRQIMQIFRKNIRKSFGSSEKSSTFALAFRKTVLLKQINC